MNISGRISYFLIFISIIDSKLFIMNTPLTIKATKGKYGLLDRAYLNYLISKINIDEQTSKRWEIYLEIIDIIITLNNPHEFKSIKYRLTDGEDPNLVMLDLINRYGESDSLIKLYETSINGFIEEDWLGLFQ